jgi:hypothetical protein
MPTRIIPLPHHNLNAGHFVIGSGGTQIPEFGQFAAPSKKKPIPGGIGFVETGSSSWTRTSDHSINSRMLYQLSYRGMSVRPIAEGYTD